MSDEKLIHDIVKHQKSTCSKPKSEKKDITYFDYDNDLGNLKPKYNDPIKQREL